MTGVKTIYHGEHHMSAATIEMILPFSVMGQTSLFSTNGKVVSAKTGAIEYLHDALVVLKLDLKTQKVEHLLVPQGKYISEFSEHEGGFKLGLYDSHSCSEELLLAHEEAIFKPGFGPVKNGLFPSAFEAHVNAIKSNQ